MTGLNNLKQAIYALNRYFNLFGIVLLLLMIGFVVVDILSRLALNMPLSASYELVEYTMAMVIVFSLGYTQVNKGHINVMTLIELLPNKWQAICDRLINFTALLFFSLISWQTFVKGGMDKISGTTSPVLFIPKYPFSYIASLGFALMSLVLLMQVIIPDDEAIHEKKKEQEAIF